MAVPRKGKRESLVAYHDRLSALSREALQAGDIKTSEQLQRAAGKIAKTQERVRKQDRDGNPGPGTYPWNQCIKDKRREGYDDEASKKVCGAIRGQSRKRYPAYWKTREGNVTTLAVDNPIQQVGGPFGGNPLSDGKPLVGFALDGGPHLESSRDHVFIFDRGGAVLEHWPVSTATDIAKFNAAHPNLPVFGPFKVIVSEVRRLKREVRQAARIP